MIRLINRAKKFAGRTAVISEDVPFAYLQLLDASAQVAATLLNGKKDLNEERIAFMVPGSFEYVKIQWGIWRAGGIAVPLSIHHPLPSLRYVLEDTRASVLIVATEYKEMLQSLAKELGIRMLGLEDQHEEIIPEFPEVVYSRGAMILYTSGTTSLPKGVVTTHANIEAQITTLVKAWRWEPADHILCVLPLHHVHGIINVVSCALWSGACVQFIPKFGAHEVFEVFLKGRINLFMAVPTIYFKLIAHWESLPEKEQMAISECLQKFRLMVSGSAALPVSVLEKWRKISGHTLLERYGMTEIGMAVSNPYSGERRPGHIGLPLPGVELRLADESNQPVPEGQPGEIQIKGPSVFQSYWQKPEATAKAFTWDGWFKTGDIAVFNDGCYKILGRDSVDIIKSGGYKISALEIEEILRTHPLIKDCGVVGIPDEEWGEIVVASLVLEKKEEIDFEELKNWLKEQLPAYKVPRRFIIQKELPRNALGKVTKKELQTLF